MIFYFLYKALIQFFSNILCKSTIILHTRYCRIAEIAVVLSIAHHSIVFK